MSMRKGTIWRLFPPGPLNETAAPEPAETDPQRNRRLRLTETSGRGLRFTGGYGPVIDPFAKPGKKT